MLMNGANHFMTFETIAGDEIGLIKYNDLMKKEANWLISLKVQADSQSKIYGSTIGYATSQGAIIIAGNLVEAIDQKTYLGHFMIKDDGNSVWNHLIQLEDSVQT